MKTYLLCIIPDEKTNYQIRKVVGDIGNVFKGQGIDVRWNKPETFHIPLMYLNMKLGMVSEFLLGLKLKNVVFPSLKLVFDGCMVGNSRRYKELVYITFADGGDNLRKTVFQLREILGLEEGGQYIPHISLGRLSTDLSSQEYTNVISDIRETNKGLTIKGYEFVPTQISLLEINDNNYRVLRNFSISKVA